MSKRCQDLATFVESLMDDTPVPQDELRVEIQDADYSYFVSLFVFFICISSFMFYPFSDYLIQLFSLIGDRMSEMHI